MKNREFDRLVSEIRKQEMDDDVIREAANRVLTSISGANVTSADPDARSLRSCADFQTLLAGYQGRRLSPARSLLVEDHLHQCVACRHALANLGRGDAAFTTSRHSKTNPRPLLRWALAGALAAGIGIGIFAGNAGLLPGQHRSHATVEEVDGSLYYVGQGGNRLVPAGYKMSDGGEFRTAKGSRAEVRLNDGSLIEVDERSQFSLSRGWRGTTVHLDGGNIIVQAANQRTGRLSVATDDCLVSAKGTVFLVNHGTKGSRISVLQGVVNVAYGRHREEVRAGQTTTSRYVSKVPIQDEIAWSKDAAHYLALVGELQLLQKQFEAIPGPGLRYKSDLLEYVPSGTVVYAAVPNIGPTLSEASRLFEDRLQQSPVLRSWWKQQQGRSHSDLQEVMKRIESFSSYLGDELVLAVAQNGNEGYTAPVLLANVRRSGLREFLEDQNQQRFAGNPHASLRIVDDPWQIGGLTNSSLLVYLNDSLMVATSDPAELRRMAAIIRQQPSGSFRLTPFYQKILQSYGDGAGWLFCVDMEQILARSVHDLGNRQALPPGFSNVRYLTLERRDVGKAETRASITFAPQREGMAAWLAEPAPMGSLEFVSPEASLAGSFVIKDPKSVLEEIFQFAGTSDPNFNEHLAEFESHLGVSLLNDISGPLGGEMTIALDGPVLPVPSWKFIMEVYDQNSLQATMSKLVESFNRQAPPEAGRLELSERQIGSQTYFTLRNKKHAFEMVYTFADSYWIVGPNQALLARAIQNRQTGYTLTRSQAFQSQLPSDGYTNFSAILYHNLAPVMANVSEQLKTIGTLNSDEQRELDMLRANSTPGLIYAYGEPDRIVVASSTGFMGLNLDSLLAISEGQPQILPHLLGSSTQYDHARIRGENAGR